MQGLKRRIVYVALYEAIAIAVSGLAIAHLFGVGAGHAMAVSAVASLVAVLWNLGFNALFEAWEARQAVRGRSLGRRVAHAIGFEGGLIVALVPLFAVWLGISLWEAFVLDLGMLLFFLGYTFVFTLAFDRVFGLPASARPCDAV
jgi:uncharacterized membrane protein